jgi:hypothetical protein
MLCDAAALVRGCALVEADCPSKLLYTPYNFLSIINLLRNFKQSDLTTKCTLSTLNEGLKPLIPVITSPKMHGEILQAACRELLLMMNNYLCETC